MQYKCDVEVCAVSSKTASFIWEDQGLNGRLSNDSNRTVTSRKQDDITDLDLYGDLELDVNQQISYEEIKEKCEQHMLTIDELQKKNNHLIKQNEILKKNISSLYLTARNEITRKDAEIKRLQDIEVRNRKHRQAQEPSKAINQSK